MIRKLVWTAALFGTIGLLLGTNQAFAQRGGHGGGHGGGQAHGGAHYGGGAYHGSHYGGAWHGANYHNGYSHNGYYGHGYYGGGYYPGIFGGISPWLGSYSSPWYGGYSYPRYSYYDYDPPVTYYPAPTRYYAEPTPVANDSATIRVILPDSQARVWFDGNPTQQTGTDRYFHSPALTSGSPNTYSIRVSWMQGDREMSFERVVTISPGQTTVVDFTRPQ